MFIWAEGPAGLDMEALYWKAVEKNVAFVPGRYFYTAAGEGLEEVGARHGVSHRPDEEEHPPEHVLVVQVGKYPREGRLEAERHPPELAEQDLPRGPVWSGEAPSESWSRRAGSRKAVSRSSRARGEPPASADRSSASRRSSRSRLSGPTRRA